MLKNFENWLLENKYSELSNLFLYQLTMEIKALKLRWLCFFDFIFCFFRMNNSPTFSF